MYKVNAMDYWDSRIKAKMIALEPSKLALKVMDLIAWTKAPAFVVNPRGILIHRVRHVSTFVRNGCESHHHVDYLCGNGCNIDISHESVFYDDPPQDKLLCSVCDIRAEIKSDVLVGRHVHIGVLVAQQICCRTPLAKGTRVEYSECKPRVGVWKIEQHLGNEMYRIESRNEFCDMVPRHMLKVIT